MKKKKKRKKRREAKMLRFLKARALEHAEADCWAVRALPGNVRAPRTGTCADYHASITAGSLPGTGQAVAKPVKRRKARQPRRDKAARRAGREGPLEGGDDAVPIWLNRYCWLAFFLFPFLHGASSRDESPRWCGSCFSCMIGEPTGWVDVCVCARACVWQ